MEGLEMEGEDLKMENLRGGEFGGGCEGIKYIVSA
jgi:hypothetical protein